jgi:putative ABC transport system permease protein
MFKNYLKTSLRFLRRNKGFTLINMVGLSIGTFSCLYILLYVRDQYSYDRYFTRSGDMYRVVTQAGETRSGVPRMQATTTPPVGPALAIDFQDDLISTRIAPTIGSEQHVVRYNYHNDGKEVYEKNAFLVDPNGLDLAKAPSMTVYSASGVRYKIAGVLKDFNYQSLHDQISPFMLVYKMNRFDFNHLIVKASSSHYTSLLQNMERLWKLRVFVEPFKYSFLSDDVRKMYEAEFIMSRIITSLTVFAIIISCLGLFGLAAFSAEQRTKEIGIRKIMGASVLRIVRLLSMDFLLLICLSFLLAIPITWWIMNRWLNVFAYRIEIRWWMFGVSGGAAIVIAMTVVSFQAAKAAVVNPVKSLRAD